MPPTRWRSGTLRFHESIARSAEISSGVFEVADLESHNGTQVNGKKVSRKAIEHGDRIRVGSSEYVFLSRSGGQGRAEVFAWDGLLSDSGLLTVRLDRSGLPADAAWVGGMARDLSAFFKIANVINSTRDVEALQRELLALISEVIPAAQGAIILQSSRNDERGRSVPGIERASAEQEMPIREEPVQQATWERSAVFSAASAENNAAEHVLCVPLMGVERTMGVIYLSSPGSAPTFREEYAYFLSSVSRIAAVTLENLSKLDSLRAENQRLRGDVKANNTPHRREPCHPAGARVHRARGGRGFHGADSR